MRSTISPAIALALCLAAALAIGASLWPEQSHSFSFEAAAMATEFRAAEGDAGVPARESVAGSVGSMPIANVQEVR